MAAEQVIKEIVCLKSIQLETGRPRVLKPSDFSEGLHWERLVEVAMAEPASFEIHRDTIYTEEQQSEDLSKVELKDMTTMSRERVAEVANFYGIKDEGQGRSTLIDQIASEKEQEAKVLAKTQAAAAPAAPTAASGVGDGQ